MIYKSNEFSPVNIQEIFEQAKTKKRYINVKNAEIKAAVNEDNDDEDLIIEGMANLAAEDRIDEIIDSKAWDIKNYLKNPVILYEHNHMCPVGISLQVEPRDDGLYYKGIIGSPKKAELTDEQKKVRSLLRQGILKANSVGFIPVVMEYDEEKETLRYMKVELLEISIVSIPMQQDSLITSVKNLEKGKTMPEEKLNEVHKMCSEMGPKMDEVHKMVGELKPKVDEEAGKKISAELVDVKAKLDVSEKQVIELKAKLEVTEKGASDLLETLKKTGLVK